MAAPLIDQMLTHAIYFERYKNHEAEQLINVLDAANAHCKAVISKSKSIPTKTRYLDIMKEIKGIRDEAVEKIDKQLTLDLNELVGSEINHQSRIIKSIGIDLDIIKPASQKVFTAATFMPFASSQTFESTLRQLGDGMYEQWDMAVRTGYLTGETAREINRRVLGSVKDQLPGTMKKIRNSFDANTKTMLSHYAEHARDAVYEANSDIIIGYRRLETLDGRTCLECGLADGNTYKTLKEAPPLPAHHRCRGIYLPILRGIDNYDGERATKDGPVSAKTDWKEWFDKQPADLQKDILGPARYELYKKGSPLGGFVPDGRKLTLKQWYEKNM